MLLSVWVHSTLLLVDADIMHLMIIISIIISLPDAMARTGAEDKTTKVNFHPCQKAFPSERRHVAMKKMHSPTFSPVASCIFTKSLLFDKK
jgi:hypothetical protein